MYVIPAKAGIWGSRSVKNKITRITSKSKKSGIETLKIDLNSKISKLKIPRSGHVPSKRISPLRFTSVEMTDTGRGVLQYAPTVEMTELIGVCHWQTPTDKKIKLQDKKIKKLKISKLKIVNCPLSLLLSEEKAAKH